MMIQPSFKKRKDSYRVESNNYKLSLNHANNLKLSFRNWIKSSNKIYYNRSMLQKCLSISIPQEEF